MSFAGFTRALDPSTIGADLGDALAAVLGRPPSVLETKALARAVVLSVNPAWVTGTALSDRDACVVGERYELLVGALQRFAARGEWPTYVLWPAVTARIEALAPKIGPSIMAARRRPRGRPPKGGYR